MLLLSAWGQAVTETVSIGAGYSNQTWYQLASGNTTSAPKAEWDIAFDLSPQGSSILFNTVTGAELWQYPHSDTTGWATLDTAGIAGWELRWNSDTSWAEGAFSRYYTTSNPFDLGWGIYSTFTHYVTGDSLYVVRLANGAYKKLWIRRLASGVYTFTSADLNGANPLDRSITKSSYPGKNFVYYSLQNDAVLDREPLAADWDLLFTQYTAFIPSAYSVTGVLSNRGYQVAEASPVDVNTYTDWSAATFQTAMNGIGYDWKTFAGAWNIADSLVYFVQKPSGEVWKLVFTGFGGSGTGEFHFTKEMLNATGVGSAQMDPLATVEVYPNPSHGRPAHLRYALEKPCKTATVALMDLTGKQVYAASVVGMTGSHVVELPQEMAQGVYLVRLDLDGHMYTRRWVVQ